MAAWLLPRSPRGFSWPYIALTLVATDQMKEILALVDLALRSHGFKKRSQVFEAKRGNITLLISLQTSTKNAGHRTRFTVNLGLVCGDLVDHRVDVEKLQVEHAQLRIRLGRLLDPPGDKWWELTSSDGGVALGDEVASLLIHRGLPYLERFASYRALIELWESGQSPGLTEGQRLKYLAQLKALDAKAQ